MAYSRIQAKAFLVIAALSVGISFSRIAWASDEDDVRAVVSQESAGWRSFDAAKIASCYTTDAIWQHPLGVRFHSRIDFEAFLGRLFQRASYRSAPPASEPKIVKVRFPAPNVATVWSEESGPSRNGKSAEKGASPRHTSTLEVLVKQGDAWKISECLIMDQTERW